MLSVLSSGILQPALVSAATQPWSEPTNHESYWQDAGYGTCTKTDGDGQATSFVMPTAPTNSTWSLLVLKGGQYNETYENPTAGQTYNSTLNDKGDTNPNNDSYIGISHIITCYKATTTTSVTPQAPSVEPACGPNNDIISLPTQVGVTYTQTGWVNNSNTVTATAQPTYTLSGTASWTYTDQNTTCSSQDKEIVTPTVTQQEVCGSNNDTYTVVDGANYDVVDNKDGTFTLTAANGYIFSTSGTNTETLTAPADKNTPCPVIAPCVVTTGPEKITKKSDFADVDESRTAGHYEFVEDGVRIYTDNNTSQAKVAWYHAVDYSLAEIGEPSIDYDSTFGIEPGMQIALDKDGNGTVEGYLVGEPDSYGNNWWSNTDFGVGAGMGYASYGTLQDYLDANPNAVVKAVGFSLGSGIYADGVLKSLTFGCHTWTFGKEIVPVTTCPAVLPTIYSTNKAHNGWTIPADAQYVNGGIQLNVSGNWDETYISRSMVGPLADIGTRVDFSANPEQYVGLHIVMDDGRVLVYEHEGSYAGQWWSTSSFGVASGMGYATFDTLENIVAANPGLMTSELRVLYTSPLASSTVVTSVTVGCTVYIFNKEGSTLGDTDVCPNITGSQATVPSGMTKNPVGNCVTDVSGGQGGGHVLATSTDLPATLPATGATNNLYLIIIAALATYGAVYFAQGRRQITK